MQGNLKTKAGMYYAELRDNNKTTLINLGIPVMGKNRVKAEAALNKILKERWCTYSER